MTNNLVERLRKGGGNYLTLTDEAADLIEQLQRELDEARDRLAEVERQRDAWKGEVTGFSIKDYHDGKRDGFRAGIEAAAGCEKEVGIAFGFCCDETGEEYNQGWIDCTEHWLEEIRALAGKPAAPSVAEAARDIADIIDKNITKTGMTEHRIILDGTAHEGPLAQWAFETLTLIRDMLRALAAREGE